MNLEEFNEKFKNKKRNDYIEVLCEHPNHNDKVVLQKLSVERNIKRNNNEKFICQKCYQRDNPNFNKKENINLKDQNIKVICPECGDQREIKSSSYFGSLEGEEPYLKVCRDCCQKGKIISEKQKKQISESLTGKHLSEETKEKLSNWRKEHPEAWQDCLINVKDKE